MQTYTIKEAAQALGWKKSRIEKMISRGEFVPQQGAARGIYGRAWTFDDVIRLAIFEAIPFMRSGGRAKVLSEVPFGDLSDRFLMIEKLAGPDEVHEYATGLGMMQELRKPDDAVRIVRSGDMGELLKNPWASRVILISLENFERRIRDALAAIRHPKQPPEPEVQASEPAAPVRKRRAPKPTTTEARA